MCQVRNKNLVLVRAGKKSLHPSWLEGGVPNFDLAVIAYEPIPDDSLIGVSHATLIPGAKVHGLGLYFAEAWPVISRYERVAIIDDDIAASADDINRSFALGSALKLSIWQPSLTLDSHFSHGITLNNRLFTVRFTNFVEMMCPFFSLQHLAKCRFTFELGLESGIDQMWCRIGGLTSSAAGILDGVAVKHTRKVGEFRADQGFTGETADYLTYIKAAQERLKYSFSGAVSYGGILRTGHAIKSRVLMAVLTVVPIFGYRQASDGRWFLRPIVNHCGRNLLTDMDRSDLGPSLMRQHLQLRDQGCAL